jgi:hypothetical protein
MVSKSDFISDFGEVLNPKLLVIAIEQDGFGVDIITTSDNILSKFLAYAEDYDDNLCLISNPSRRIVNWMVI